jgi:protein-arginine kinase activator protein McsA
MACDICGRTGISLEDVQTFYQTNDIKQICSNCAKDINKHLGKIRTMNIKITEHWLKRFMTSMKTKFS